ncbi:CBS domain-containing protein [Streptomyces sp. NBC_01728]|uniref:CBS domain-containing protein n=1 Tax=unclassified Streptomyces TaxID=2593676 RepID=UPI002256B23D|nr:MULTISPECIES: CBS domain-containing protein [unclassified Streptomyces]MCX4458898.1 CBS domain-containing protein [Streptomyces sp. NBC_01719]MCX4498255.1 CBS domain-containing protein [Streptomyces sp. NBC_01728]MCX4595876.1 CBS domain-containing protein [Streptomyces sp. NBC_01549]
MNDHENFSAEAEARQDLPSQPWSPGEAGRQDMLIRYLGAVATAAAEHAHAEEQAPARGTARPAASPSRQPSPPEAGVPLVRDVMDVPAASLRDDLPYRDIARLLAREQVGALPVVDGEGHVVGVVSESDLLAKVAFEASGHRPGRIGRLRERRIYSKARGETAADLMTSPAVTVLPGATVAEAAWLAALSRLKRLPVTDGLGRLVGVVPRDALLQALIRDDAGIRAEVEARMEACCQPGDRATVEVAVHDGIVELTGRMPSATTARLVAEVEDIADVVEVKNLLTAA